MPVNDVEALWMLNKKGNKEPSFNGSTVEAPFGTLKIKYSIDNISIT